MKTKLNEAFLLAVLLALSPFVHGQAVFAHNDYLKPDPFYKAFGLKAEYIEADIFLENGRLLVAHTHNEIKSRNTLELMYLQPLSKKVKTLYGLNLMIDIKSDGASTLSALVKLLEKHRELIRNKKLHFVISGNYPPASEWKNYPAYIWFDGRPNVEYTPDQIQRLRLISTGFSSISTWNGEGKIPEPDLTKIKETIAAAHKLNMPMRFWGSPDSENAWKKFIDAGVDIINSDNIEPLTKFIQGLRAESQRSR